MTTDHARKSSRFREIFKSRSSMSPSNVDLTAKSPSAFSPLSPSTSPISHTVKPGLEKVGLLPSERNSFSDAKRQLEHQGGGRVAELLDRQEKELKDVSVPHNVDTNLDAAGVGQADKVARQVAEEEKIKKADIIAEAFKNALIEHRDENTDGAADVAEGESSTLREIATKETSSLMNHTRPQQLRKRDGTSFFDFDNGNTWRIIMARHMANCGTASIDMPANSDDDFIFPHKQAETTHDTKGGMFRVAGSRKYPLPRLEQNSS